MKMILEFNSILGEYTWSINSPTQVVICFKRQPNNITKEWCNMQMHIRYYINTALCSFNYVKFLTVCLISVSMFNRFQRRKQDLLFKSNMQFKWFSLIWFNVRNFYLLKCNFIIVNLKIEISVWFSIFYMVYTSCSLTYILYTLRNQSDDQ